MLPADEHLVLVPNTLGSGSERTLPIQIPMSFAMRLHTSLSFSIQGHLPLQKEAQKDHITGFRFSPNSDSDGQPHPELPWPCRRSCSKMAISISRGFCSGFQGLLGVRGNLPTPPRKTNGIPCISAILPNAGIEDPVV